MPDKSLNMHQQPPIKKILLFLLLICCGLFCSSQQRSIPDLIRLISDHQFPNNPLVEGSYTKGGWEQVQQAVRPQTMYWSYPVGVVLLGMQRGYEITHDQNVLRYVTDNNRISADAFFWMCWQLSTFGKIYRDSDLEKLLRYKKNRFGNAGRLRCYGGCDS